MNDRNIPLILKKLHTRILKTKSRGNDIRIFNKFT